MSDILIKNMDMPESCTKCRFFLPYLWRYKCFALKKNIDTEKYTFDYFEYDRFPDCPLVVIKN